MPVPTLHFARALQFPGSKLRQSWVVTELQNLPRETGGAELERLLRASEAGDPRAREAVAAVVHAIVADPQREVWTELHELSRTTDWFHLQRLLQTGPAPVQQARPVNEQRIPDYGAGRELTLGERRSIARRPSRRDFEKLLADPHPMVIALLLGNPRAVEADVVRLATARPARVPLLVEIARSHWIERARVRASFLHNPGTPSELCVPLLYVCTRPELMEVARSATVQPVLQRGALELLEQRPPLPERVQHPGELH